MSQGYTLNLDRESQCIRVGGELSFTTVNNVLVEMASLLENVTSIDIDLAEVTRSDSAGLALLIEWMRSADKESKEIVFHNIPEQMLAIAGASGLDEILPLQ
ncbi:MAG: lipid asymmetry maintenance protein MlaB [Methylophagaceae bacterium]